MNASGERIGTTPEGDRAEDPGDWYYCQPGWWNEANVTSTGSGTCTWAKTDSPKLPAPALAPMKAWLTFLGVIYDACDGAAVRAIDSFQVHLSGRWPFIENEYHETPIP